MTTPLIPTGFQARVEADSRGPTGRRLTTMVVTYPRCIHSEMMTHRVFSRNSSSSRAIPVEKSIAVVEQHPFLPIVAANKKGMQAGEGLNDENAARFRVDLHELRRGILHFATVWKDHVHKQWLNRYLEPYGWITVVISSTFWKNFFKLRCHPAAQPEMREIACMMKAKYDASTPKHRSWDDWHLPFVPDEERAGHGLQDLKLISAGRCARVSYLTHDGKRDVQADIALGKRLSTDRHLSPFEHQATPFPGRHGNFLDWKQQRQEITNESGEEDEED